MPETAIAERAPLLSLVVPVYNEVEVLPAFHAKASEVLDGIAGLDHEIIYVDDGSSDGSLELLHELAAADERVGVVKFSRNFGHQVAITAGLDVARGDCIVFIDADLQDPPEVICDMVAEWREGFDVVYGRREVREGETRFKLFTAAIFYRLLGRITNVQIPHDVGDFRLLSRRAAGQLRRMREKDRFVRGLVSWIGFRQTAVVYRRDRRFAGDSKYPLRKMIRFALDGITSFSTMPLKMASWLGYLASLTAFLYLATVFVQKWMGVTVEGWATIMVALLFLGGVQLICIGFIGEYLGRIFNEIKPRPMYIIEEHVGSGRKVGDDAERAVGELYDVG